MTSSIDKQLFVAMNCSEPQFDANRTRICDTVIASMLFFPHRLQIYKRIQSACTGWLRELRTLGVILQKEECTEWPQ